MSKFKILRQKNYDNFQAEQKRPKTEGPIFEDLNMPISFIDTKCENKNCRSTEKVMAQFS